MKFGRAKRGSSSERAPKPRSTEDDVSEDGDSESVEPSGMEMLMSRFSFHPLYIFGDWTDAKAGFAKRLTVAGLLPSVINTTEFRVSITDGGNMLHVSLQWPSQMRYPENYLLRLCKMRACPDTPRITLRLLH